MLRLVLHDLMMCSHGRPLLRFAVATFALLAAVDTTGAHASVPMLTPTVEATYSSVYYDESQYLDGFDEALLRADGSFAVFSWTPNEPHEALPLVMGRYGGPVPLGTLVTQAVAGGEGGSVDLEGPLLSGVDGTDWFIDSPEWRMARPGEVPTTEDGWHEAEAYLVGIDDRARVVRRTLLGYKRQVYGARLIATGAGVRVITSDARDRTVVRQQDGLVLARFPKFLSIRSALGQPDGSMLYTLDNSRRYDEKRTKMLYRLGRDGRSVPVRDARGRTVQNEPRAVLRNGILLAREVGDERIKRIAVLTRRGTYVSRRLRDLPLPWSGSCRRQGQGHWLAAIGVSPRGTALLGIECVVEGNRGDDVLDALTVELDDRLRPRWVARGAGAWRVGADGRLYDMVNVGREYVSDWDFRERYELRAIRLPGVGPKQAQVLSVHKAVGGVVVRLRCEHPIGTVCSGRVRVARAGGASTVVPYAMLGRPGGRAAVIRRHVTPLPRGSGALAVTVERAR